MTRLQKSKKEASALRQTLLFVPFRGVLSLRHVPVEATMYWRGVRILEHFIPLLHLFQLWLAQQAADHKANGAGKEAERDGGGGESAEDADVLI